MKREEQPILIVDETGIDFFLHIFGLTADLRAYIGDLHRFARLVFSLEGDPVSLGFPSPTSVELESGNVQVEGVTDRFDLSPRVEAIRLGNLVCDWRALLRPAGQSCGH